MEMIDLTTEATGRSMVVLAGTLEREDVGEDIEGEDRGSMEGDAIEEGCRGRT